MHPKVNKAKDVLCQLDLQFKYGLKPKEINVYMAMRQKPRMRVEYKRTSKQFLVHDMSDNVVYYVKPEHLPEWAKDGMALLQLLTPESEIEDVGFFYAPGIYYLDIKSSVPMEHRRKHEGENGS